MEKLIKNFTKIIADDIIVKGMSNNIMDCSVEFVGQSPYILAEECKKIAIAFAVYCSNEDLTNVTLPDGTEVFMRVGNGTLTHEQVFDKFIKEEYGKQ